ncbi:MAG: glycosyltransferase [Solirubrobacteraceae bacterium]|nr:glycosyltransferase [Solirubrobacteraceae bacterium]
MLPIIPTSDSFAHRPDLTVDVAMTVCDGERYLEEQLQSIAGQTRAPTRLLVHDDASSDASAEILGRFAANAPFPVWVFSADVRIGSARSFERVLAACSADIVLLSDHDDRWSPNRLSRIVEQFATGDRPSLVYSDGRLIDAVGQPTGATIWEVFAAPDVGTIDDPDLILRTLVAPFVPGCTIAISRALLAAALPFPRGLSLGAVGLEHDGWLVGLGWAQGAVVALPEPLIDYRIHEDQQVGLPARRTIRSHVVRPGGPGRHRRSELARRAAAATLLREGLDRYAPTSRSRRCADDLDALIAHLDARRQLPRSPVARTGVVRDMWRTGSYKRFSSGHRSVAVDLLALRPSRTGRRTYGR